MKNLITTLIISFMCCIMSAKERLDVFDLIEVVCKDKISATAFQIKYSEYIIKDDEAAEIGLFSLDNVYLGEYICETQVTISPALNLRGVVVMPDYNLIDDNSRFVISEHCHEHIISRLGNPTKIEDTSYKNVYSTTVAAELSIENSKTYKWESIDNIPYSSTWAETKNGNLYTFMAVTSSVGFEIKTPIQRKFFKSLELGKDISKQQIASTLEVYSMDIKEVRNSSGKTYNYWDKTYFGGIEWSFVEFRTVGSKFSAIEFTHTNTKNNQEIFDDLFRALSQKYGDPMTMDNEAMWIDRNTFIFLTYQYAESKGGEMRHYVELSYSDTSLMDEAEEIINGEL